MQGFAVCINCWNDYINESLGQPWASAAQISFRKKTCQKEYGWMTVSRCRCLQSILELWAKASCFLNSAQPLSMEGSVLRQHRTPQRAVFPMELPWPRWRFSQSYTVMWDSSYSFFSLPSLFSHEPDLHQFEGFPQPFLPLLCFCVSWVFSPKTFFALLDSSLLPRRTNTVNTGSSLWRPWIRWSFATGLFATYQKRISSQGVCRS